MLDMGPPPKDTMGNAWLSITNKGDNTIDCWFVDLREVPMTSDDIIIVYVYTSLLNALYAFDKNLYWIRHVELGFINRVRGVLLDITKSLMGVVELDHQETQELVCEGLSYGGKYTVFGTSDVTTTYKHQTEDSTVDPTSWKANIPLNRTWKSRHEIIKHLAEMMYHLNVDDGTCKYRITSRQADVLYIDLGSSGRELKVPLGSYAGSPRSVAVKLFGMISRHTWDILTKENIDKITEKLSSDDLHLINVRKLFLSGREVGRDIECIEPIYPVDDFIS